MANLQVFGPYSWSGSLSAGQAHVWTIAMPHGGKVFAASAIPFFNWDASGDIFPNVMTVEEIDVTRAIGGRGWFLSFLIRNKGPLSIGAYQWHFSAAS